MTLPESSGSPESALESPDQRRHDRRRVIERSWVLGVVVFVLARFLAAYSALGEESRATVVVFGLLDVGTAVPYAIGTARLVTSLVDRDVRAATAWGALATGSFVAPYVWIAWAGRRGEFPTYVYWAIVLFVVFLGANAVLTIRRKVADGRVGRSPEDCSEPPESNDRPG